MTGPLTRPILEQPGPSQTLAVEARALGKMIDTKHVLRQIDLVIPHGRFVALLGANGAGKTTLLRTIAMLLPATSGTLHLFGEPASRGAVRLRRRIGVIGHEPMLYRDLSALENLMFFGRLYEIDDVRTRAHELLESVGLAGRADDPVKTYSRGMLQRVAIARALMHDAELILADEPFTGLDAPSRLMLEELLRRLHDEGRTIILANHDVGRSLELTEQAVVLRDGALVLDEPSAALEAAALVREVMAA